MTKTQTQTQIHLDGIARLARELCYTAGDGYPWLPSEHDMIAECHEMLTTIFHNILTERTGQ